MGLHGVASVCKLDLGEFKSGVDHLYKVAADIHEVATKIVGGVQSLLGSGHGLAASIKSGILSGGRQLWYTALREAEGHLRNGRLADFNSLAFETPCRRDIEFQWGVFTRQQAMDFLAELYMNDSIRSPDEGVNKRILHILWEALALPDLKMSNHAQKLLRGLEKEDSADKQTLFRAVLADPSNRYPFMVRLPTPASSSLLVQAQDVSDLDYSLYSALYGTSLKKMEAHRERNAERVKALKASEVTIGTLSERIGQGKSSTKAMFKSIDKNLR
ncbi:hypothetical protein BGZ96_005522 [Linnemannia gamsii]|uniref:Arm-like repeat domain-containing protein n=1 Tax=Linnemannia gamsii TaxID=64522 RepID=A0ABQ7KFF4_9FUNG|nr:hypothetical protein BGZ96_005522 [Linnemannia gamsii]